MSEIGGARELAGVEHYAAYGDAGGYMWHVDQTNNLRESVSVLTHY